MKIAILVDSSFDGDVKKIKDLYLAPLLIVEEDGTTHSNDELLDKEKFYKLLSEQNLKTALTPPGIMMEIWDKLLKEFDQIIFLPISKGLSGQFQTYRFFSETEDAYKGRVFVCDTNGVSVANQEIARRVAFWIAENKTGFEIMELVKKAGEQIVGFIIPKNLETLKRGGRISAAAASLAKILKIVPILRYDGIIDKETSTRTFKKAIYEAADLLKKEVKNSDNIYLAYSKMDNQLLEKIIEMVKSRGLKISLISELSPVIACHTGEETIALLSFKDGIGR